MKAIALISGGLDSILAARVAKEAGIEVIPIHFKIPFCHRDKAVSRFDASSRLISLALGVELRSVDISEDFMRMLVNPRYGFGAHMNPCIDCKILMLAKAKELSLEQGAGFVVTGEVLGQRPMSQHRAALKIIEKRSGLPGLVVRPLSARLLEETIPEKEGWIQREKLLDFSGRSRRAQMDLAEGFKIQGYPNASGGCLLTDAGFTRRIQDLIRHKELTLHNVELLKIGRHFRLSSGVKLVVGRDEKEDRLLENLAQNGEYLFLPNDLLAGPSALGVGIFNQELISVACSLVCRYCDLNGKHSEEIVYRILPHLAQGSLTVSPLRDEDLDKMKI